MFSTTKKRTTSQEDPTRPSHWANASGTLFKNPWPSAAEPTWTDLWKGTSPVTWHNAKTLDHVQDIKVIKPPDWGGAAALAKQYPKGGKKRGDYFVGTWLGHAGAMVEIPPLLEETGEGGKDGGSVYLIFDPIFSYRAGPTQFTGPARLRETPCQVQDLPGCHVVFVSHNHYDHMDTNTIAGILARFSETLWFVPLGNKKWMLESGVSSDNIIELDWWQEREIQVPAKTKQKTTLKVTCAPAQHNSARSTLDKNTTLWCGWVIQRLSPASQAIRGTIYHAGDTGYRPHTQSLITCPIFRTLGSKLGPFDLSFIPIWRGGTLGFVSYFGLKLSQNAIPVANHIYPRDAVEVHRDVRSRCTVGVHFGTFVGSVSESKESILEFREACETAGVVGLFEGEGSGNGRAGLLDIGGSVVVNLSEA